MEPGATGSVEPAALSTGDDGDPVDAADDDDGGDVEEFESAHATPASPSTVIPPIRKKPRRSASTSRGRSRSWSDDELDMVSIKHHNRVECFAG
jgi:hypothetical protein